MTLDAIVQVYGEPDAQLGLVDLEPCDEDCEVACLVHVPSVGWNLSGGARINFHPVDTGDKRLVMVLNLSGDAVQAGIVYRQVTVQQIRAHAAHLLELASQVEKGGAR